MSRDYASVKKHGDPLKITLFSFSYKVGVPPSLCVYDEHFHGGGFVFDCRALKNPGREKEFAALTGRDSAVKQYLEALEEVGVFKQHVLGLVNLTVGNYLERSFNHLSIGFGCTGGQHRSVYFTDWLRTELDQLFGSKVLITVVHTNPLFAGGC